jgi:hypothetical protein
MAIRYKKDIITIYVEERDAERCGVDSYGKALKCVKELNTEVDDLKGDLQPMSPGEQLREFGGIVQGSYKLYLDPDVEITPTCKVAVSGYPNKFQVRGTPMKYTALKPHIKAILVEEGFDP